MAAFSHHHQALLLDSHFSSNNNNNNNNSPIIPSSFDFISEQPSSYDNDNFIQTSNSLIFSQFCPPDDYNLHKSSLTDTPSQSDVENESSVTKKLQSPQSSVVVDCYNFNHNCKIESGDEQVTQIVTTNPSPPLMDRKRKNSAKLKDGTQKAVKNKKQRKGNGIQKNGGGGGEEEATGEKETSINTSSTTNNSKKMKPKKKVTEFPPKDYIHVRARRGQATDNHSLAERVRREKISQRMKALQKLVPGCDKVTGKALMLDEIINYVQSLQNQVEFLSMKLASVNPMLNDFGMDLFDNAFMVGPFENLLNTSVSPPLLSSSLPQCGSTTQQPFTTFANTIGTTAACLTAMENYPFHVPVVDSSIASIQQAQRIPNSFPQDNESVLWDHVEDQKQKFLNTTSSGMILSNSLCSFH